MKTTEVNKELVGRRCECMCLGSMVTGVIEDITVTKYTAEVKVRYDEPQRWVTRFYTAVGRMGTRTTNPAL